MIVSEFLRDLRRDGVLVELDGKDLAIKGKKRALTPEIVTQLKTHKQKIVDFLSELSGKPDFQEPIPSQDRSEGIPLSYVQQSYWFLNQLEGKSSTYNMPLPIRLKGTLEVECLRQSLELIVSKHEVLRTNFIVGTSGDTLQLVRACEKFEIIREDVQSKGEAELLDLVQTITDLPFDLERDLLFRAHILQIDVDEYILVLNMHHIVSDGWSLNLIFSELVQNYLALVNGNENSVHTLPIQYADYAIWQKKRVDGDQFEKQLDFWKRKLDGLPPLINLPTDRQRPPAQSYQGKNFDFTIESELTSRLNKLAKDKGTTLFNTLLAGLSVLLARFSGNEDIAVGTAIANRNRVELEKMIGFFANTIVVRSKIVESTTFSELLKDIGKHMMEAYENSDVPFDAVVDAVQPKRSLSVPPLFQIMFRLHNQFVKDSGETIENLKILPFDSGVTTAKLDLNFSLVETENGLKGSVEYATDLFDESSILRLVEHYNELLEKIAESPDSSIHSYSILSERERKKINQWNDTEEAYPWDGALHNLFEQQVNNTPDKLAYVFGENTYTYDELNKEANRLANFLRSLGVGPEVRVGLFVRQSQFMGIGALGIFKAGGTYVPLNPSYPDERLEHMILDTSPDIILTQEVVEQHLPKNQAKVVCLDRDREKILRFDESNPPVPDNINYSAYILYTSGTTGKPKGILVSHPSFRNMALAQKNANLWDENNQVLQFASISFSISLWGSFMAWLSGATLFQVDDEQSMPGEPLYNLLEEKQITIATWPVSLLSVLPIEKMPSSLNTVISSAEPCTEAVAEKWENSGRRFLNLYGNSEVSLGSTLFEYKKGKPFTLGRAFPNTQMYVLDCGLQQVPTSVVGEICTGGIGIADGYVNRPQATAERFIANPLENAASSRLYRTGDLGRYLDNGEIQFIGRDDFQVNVRGFRIELNEIEDVIRESEDVRDAVVVARPDNNGIDRLVCFIVAKEYDFDIDFSQLRRALQKRLPNFMIPSLFQQLEKMPLTPNRKVDRLALPIPDASLYISRAYTAPESEIERSIADMWVELLGVEKVGVHNDFFEVGGHSLLAAQLASRIQERFEVAISVKDIFEFPTIREIAEHMEFQLAKLKVTNTSEEGDSDETETFEF